MEKKRRGRPRKQADFTKGADITKWIGEMVKDDAKAPEKMNSEASVKNFVDSMMAAAEKKKGVKQLAREKSKGATGGALKSVDPTIHRVTEMALTSSNDIVSLKRTTAENTEATKSVASSVSALESRVQDLTEQSNKTLGMLGSLMQKFNEFKSEAEKQFKKLSSGGSGGGLLDTAVDAMSSLGDAAEKKPNKSATKQPAAAKTAKASIFKSVGSLGKGMLARAPLVGGIISGVSEYVEGGELGRSIASGAGTVLGGIIGGALGTVVAPGVGTAVGGIAGSMAGEDLAKKGYDWLFGNKGPKESDAVKRARDAQDNQPKDTTGTQTSAPAPTGGGSSTKGTGIPGSSSSSDSGTASGGSGYSPADYKNDADFTAELNRVSAKFNIDANDLLAVMHSESGVRADIVNPGSKATGLIQFIPSTAKSLGTSVEELAKMTRAEQMKYVEKYFESVNLPKGASGGQIYASVFLPAYVNKKVLTTKGEAYYNANTGLDIDGDGKITMSDLDARVAQMRSKNGLGTSGKKREDATQQPGDRTAPSIGAVAVSPEGVDTSAASVSKPAVAAVSGKNPSVGAGGDFSKPAGAEGVNKGMVEKLAQIQSAFGPLKVTSGFRDPAHNARVGGAKDSAHTRANAVDVTFSGDEQKTIQLVQAASKAGIGGIGVYKPGFVHLDTESRRVWGPDYTAKTVPQWASGVLQAHMSGEMGKYDAGAAGTKETSFGGGRSEGGGMTSRGSIGPISIPRGMSETMRGPDMTSRAQIPGPIGIGANMPGMGPMAGLMSVLARGATGGLMQQSPVSAIGLVGGLLSNIAAGGSNRAPNPAFMPDSYSENKVPPAMPSQNIMREIFGTDISGGYYP